MTALPALVLAALAATSGCPAVCSADPVPEIPTPSQPVQGTVEAPELEPGSPAPSPRPLGADPLALLEEVADTQLPGPSGSLHLSPAAQTAQNPDLDVPATDDAADEADRAPDTVARHVVREAEAEPLAQGERAHAAHEWPTTDGRRVGDAGAPLTASLLLSLAAIGLYHKLSKDRALEHPARQRILAMLAKEPSLGTTDVADRLDVCYRTARHHLEVLARFDLVVQAKQRGSWRWARPERADELSEPGLPELQTRVLELLEEDPGLHLSEIARRLDAAKATVKHHLDRLDERDRVRDERVGPLRRFYPEGAEAAP